MKPIIATTLLGMAWLGFGILIAFNGLVVLAAAFLLPHSHLNVELSEMPAPLDLLARNALAIGSIQLLVGVALGMGGAALIRKKRSGRWTLQVLSIALMGWFLFLGAYIHRASEKSQDVLFPSILPIGFGLIALGSSVWALGRPRITAELTEGR